MIENNSLELFKQYRNAYDHQFIVSFKGRLSQEVLTEFGSMIRTSLSTESKIKKSLQFLSNLLRICYTIPRKEKSSKMEEKAVSASLWSMKNRLAIIFQREILY